MQPAGPSADSEAAKQSIPSAAVNADEVAGAPDNAEATASDPDFGLPALEIGCAPTRDPDTGAHVTMR